MAIDWIIVSQDLEVSGAVVDIDASGASDHLPLVINIGEEHIITSLDNFPPETYHLHAYPNPFHSFLTFDFESNPSDRISLIIFDVTGTAVLHFDNYPHQGLIELNLSGLPPNVYHFQLISPKGTFTGALIKSN